MDRASLQWVRADIDESLKQARVNLETYASDPAEVHRMLECSETLHGVQGVLEMLEVYGISLLLDELEKLSRAVYSGEVMRREDACEVLMQGIAQVPDYLDFLARGNRDNPIVLMPMLNDVRSVRGQTLLSENALFSPDLDATLPVRERPVALDGDEFVAYVRKLRPHFQRGLVAWFRDTDATGALQTIESVLAHVQRLVGSSPSAKLWWVARAFLDALSSGGLEHSTSAKQLMGQLDSELRRFVRDGAKATAEAGSRELLKNLLYYCARSRPGGKRLEIIRSAFGLDQLVLPGRDLSGEAPTNLFGPDLDTVGTVAVALKDTLARIEDALDRFNRAENKSVSDLQPLIGMLQQIGDTLGLLGLGTPRRTVAEQQHVLASLIERHQLPDENQLIDLAAALLNVTKAIDKVVDRGIAGDMSRDEEVPSGEATQLSGVEHIQLVVSVVGEAKADISLIRDAIATFISEGKPNPALGEIPGRVSQIVGGMRMLFLEQAADLIEQWLAFVTRELLRADELPDQNTLDAIAEGIESLDYYLESVAGASDDCDSRLRHAATVIEALPLPGPTEGEPALAADTPSESALQVTGGGEANDSIGADADADDAIDWADEPVTSFVAVEAGHLDDEESDPEAHAGSSAAPVDEVARHDDESHGVAESTLAGGVDDATYLEFPAPFDETSAQSQELVDEEEAPSEVTLTGDMPDAIARSLLQARDLLDRMDEDQPENLVGEGTADEADEMPAAPTPEELALTQGFVMNDDIDEEIVDIFLEEAGEVLEALGTSLPAWRADPSNLDVLTEVRRSFHTLKGSGRVVGAVTVGEFCWAIENLLNRVMAGVVPPTQSVIAMVQEAVDGVPSLLKELRGEGASGVDVPDLQHRAQQLAEAWASGVGEPVAPSASFFAGQDSHNDASLASSDDLSEMVQEAEQKFDPGSTGAEILEFPLRRESPTELDAVGTSTIASPGSGATSSISEAEQYLSALRDLIDAQESAPHPYVGPLRALQGVASTAGVSSVAEACEAAEGLATALINAGTPVESRALAYFGDVTDRVRMAVGSMTADQNAEIQGVEKLVAQGRELAEILAAAIGSDTQDGLLAEREELRETFLEEAAETLDIFDEVMERWRSSGPTSELWYDLQRGLHTLKGGARMAQIAPIGDLSHALETVTAMAVSGQLESSPALLDVFEATQDQLADMLDCVVAHQPLASPEALIERINAVAFGEPAAQAPSNAEQIPAFEEARPDASGNEPDDTEKSALQGRGERVTVDAELLDNLSGYAGEISISQSRIEQQVSAIRVNLDEMDQTVVRLREQLRRLEVETESQIIYRRERDGVATTQHEDFDPLELDRFSRMQELSRGLAESVGDLTNIRDMLGGLTRESETILIQQARTNTDLQYGLTQARMLPFGRLVPRLRRVVRQTARELGRRARLEVTGEDIRVDRTILNRMVGSFEHLLRNSVDHGIEDVTTRTMAGKSAEGVVRLDITREGTEMLLKVSDDGRGISVDAVRQKAIERGLLAEGRAMADAQALQFIFEPAFSTKDEITQISGRGVGLDVVQNDAKQLGGSVRVTSETGQGAEFVVRLPLTLTINQALMVLAGHQEMGLPLANVDAVVRVPSDVAERLETSESPYYEHAGLRYPFIYLGAALGIAEPTYNQDRYPVVLIRAGDNRVAIRVDELRSRNEVVVKSVGPMLSAIRWISGATILGDGRVVLILDAPTLTTLTASVATARTVTPQVPAAEVEGRGPTVMVVDDSITVRRVTGRFLQRNGMNVLTAKDGVEALTLLQEDLPDVMLLDIEMPRMDGFELATTIRNDERMRELPIIMITSRMGAKHHERASQIGVNRYLGKPYHEGELLENINGLLPQEAVG